MNASKRRECLERRWTTMRKEPKSTTRTVQYTPPTVTPLGKVEQLTGELLKGTPDLLSHGNIL